jgi:hypothetical protein
MDNREWVKAHLTCGVDTKIVTAVDVSGWVANDSPYFMPLLERTSKYFTMQAVSADKAYLSHDNLKAVAKHNAMPYIPFKVTDSIGFCGSWCRLKKPVGWFPCIPHTV